MGGGEGEGKDGGYWERWRDGRDGIYNGGVSFVVGVGQHDEQDQGEHCSLFTPC